MAFGIIKADTLTHSTAGSVDTKYAISGTIKAFYISTTTFGTADKSFGISSSSDASTGTTTLNFTNAFDSVHYALAGVSYDGDGDFFTESKTASSVNVRHVGSYYSSGSVSFEDADKEAMVTGDLA